MFQRKKFWKIAKLKVLRKYFIMPHYAQFQSHNNVGNAKISVANLMLEEISFSLAPVWAVAVVSGVSGPGSGVQWSQSPSRARGSLNLRHREERGHICHIDPEEQRADL